MNSSPPPVRSPFDDEPPTSPPPRRRWPPDGQLPRFGIRHLFGWMVGVAVAMTATRMQYTGLGNLPAQGQASMQSGATTLLATFQGISAGTALLVSGAMFAWRQRRIYWTWQPGQLLAILEAIKCLGYVLLLVLLRRTGPSDSRSIAFLQLASYVVYFALGVWFFILVRRAGETRLWRAAMGAHAFLTLLYAVMPFLLITFRTVGGWGPQMTAFYLAYSLLPVSELAIILAAAIGDWRQRRPRHWSHNFGAGAQLANLFLRVASIVVVLPQLLRL
jgi:hypothetical protein